MKRSEFIREIRENLAGKRAEEEINEVLYDYNEHFDAGLKEGKNEEEICAELGSPGRLAQVILEDGDTTLATRPVIARVGSNPSGEQLEFAPLSSRILAFVVDTVLAGLPMTFTLGSSLHAVNASIFLPLLAAFSPLAALSFPVRVGTGPPSSPILIPGILSVAFFFLYHPVSLLILNGRTLGKALMKLKIVRRDGSSVGAGYILSRELLGRTLINTISFGFSGVISFLWALFSAERKTVHDEISGTRVIIDRRS